uniref:Uncharacterized protein n=1 Tax=Nelumbo nucifera TaxID=4432 RepID=A0A822ZXD4_NELNU|nr:TPA_asm: hypothetical protein HUJ06_017816 [Nelumbo nucifera]
MSIVIPEERGLGVGDHKVCSYSRAKLVKLSKRFKG